MEMSPIIGLALSKLPLPLSGHPFPFKCVIQLGLSKWQRASS